MHLGSLAYNQLFVNTIVNTFDINEFVKWDIIPRRGACPTPPTYLPRQCNSPRLEGQNIEAALKDSHCRSPRERPLAKGLNQLSVRRVTWYLLPSQLAATAGRLAVVLWTVPSRPRRPQFPTIRLGGGNDRAGIRWHVAAATNSRTGGGGGATALISMTVGLFLAGWHVWADDLLAGLTLFIPSWGNYNTTTIIYYLLRALSNMPNSALP